jgi:predicted TIM-barrel fold metal-dependent hydrolase
MRFDAHTHVWENWPYQPAVPDPTTRARAEQLLYQMDANGVERAVVICARIGDNPGNVDYAFAAAARHPGRLVVFPDLECRWSPDFRTPGAAERLEQALSHWDFLGFTLYLEEAEDGAWLTGPEGSPFFALAEAQRLVLSLSAMPHQMPEVLKLARQYPRLPILLHHLGFCGPRRDSIADAEAMIIAAAAAPNIHLKFSGMGNVTTPQQEFPYAPALPTWARIAKAFGPHRTIWGSDFPVSSRRMTYRQAQSMLEHHGPFASDDLAAVFHDNMARLLAR